MKRFQLTNNNLLIIFIIVLISVLSSSITLIVMKQKVNKKEKPTINEVDMIENETRVSEETTVEVKAEGEENVDENKKDVKYDNKKIETKKSSKNEETAITSDVYVCQSGWTLVMRDNRYECKQKVSDGYVYSTPIQYYCEDGSTPKNGSCTVTKEFAAGKNYECNSDEAPININHDTGYMECSLYTHSQLYLSTACEEINEVHKTCSKCKPGYYYDDLTCRPNSASNCPHGYTKLDGVNCARPATFKGYICGKDDVLKGDKCIVKILEPAKAK